jgi:mono/diheme cytochrome c family protein
MKRLIIFVIVAAVVIGGSTIAYLLFTGPRMFAQPNIRQFQAAMPVTPAGTIPVKDIYEPLPSKEQAQKLANPLDANEGNLAKGKVYYGYYCVFCHGDKGDGFGPVGYSYIPVPSDLRSAKVKSMSDGEVLYSMLTGTGHAPMLQRIIPSEYWWYLVLYVHHFGSEPNIKTEN